MPVVALIVKLCLATKTRALGLVVAFGGLCIITRWGSGRAMTLDEVGYAFITMLAPVCWAIYTVSGKPLVARHPPLLVAGIAMTFAGLFSLAFVRPSLLAQLPTLPASFWWSVLFLAWPCTVFAFSVWFGAVEQMPAGRVAGFLLRAHVRRHLQPLAAGRARHPGLGHWRSYPRRRHLADQPALKVLGQAHQPVAHGISGRLGPVPGPQLGENAAQVVLHRVAGNAQFLW